MQFIADNNVGKLARLLRMVGYDTLFFTGEDDGQMMAIALRDERVVLTRDTGVLNRRLAVQGRVKVILLTSDDPYMQFRRVRQALALECPHQAFTLCLECNVRLKERFKEDIKMRLPPHTYQTQSQFYECPRCRRLYWKGTHWEVMNQTLERLCQD